ncbi:MAG: biotin synthase BioB, partial [Candidatus Omnitrophica bacterium]|nr:biotin synthase BioB [Candidatus Omnitrophota bacterium]
MNNINWKKADFLLKLPILELLSLADKDRKQALGRRFELCSIINAKSGLCKEDCKFCAQSARYKTGIAVYPLKAKGEIVYAAKKAKEAGAKRFGIVTSGNRLSDKEIKRIADVIYKIRKEAGILTCASLGKLDKDALIMLKKSGLCRYHHNIETSRRFYPKIVSTHTFCERLNTIRSAREAGLEVCSGGIIGLGESWKDRVAMAQTLKELDVESVPLNFLIPV